MECPNGCESPMEVVQMERIFQRRGSPIVISDLAIYVCPQCGQESMPLSSARIVEHVLSGKFEPSGRFTADLFDANAQNVR